MDDRRPSGWEYLTPRTILSTSGGSGSVNETTTVVCVHVGQKNSYFVTDKQFKLLRKSNEASRLCFSREIDFTLFHV